MAVGGYFYDGVEVVSPYGNCSLSLAEFPYGTIHLGAGAPLAPGMSSTNLIETAFHSCSYY